MASVGPAPKEARRWGAGLLGTELTRPGLTLVAERDLPFPTAWLKNVASADEFPSRETRKPASGYASSHARSNQPLIEIDSGASFLSVEPTKAPVPAGKSMRVTLALLIVASGALGGCLQTPEGTASAPTLSPSQCVGSAIADVKSAGCR